MKKSMKKIWAFLITCVSAFIVFAGSAVSVFAEEEGGAAEPTNSFVQFLQDYWILLVLVVLLIAWFVYSSFRRKKQVKEGQDMLGSLRPGTYVMTQGGLIGKVVEVIVISPTEKHVVLETGGEEHKSQITYDIRAIGMVLSPERLAPRGPVEEMAMPSEEEVQKRIDDVYAPGAAIKEEEVFDYKEAEPLKEEDTLSAPEAEAPKAAKKKTTPKDPE